MSYALFFHDHTVLTLLLNLHGNQFPIIVFVLLVFFAECSPKLFLLHETLVHVFSLFFRCLNGLDVLNNLVNNIRLNLFRNFLKQFGEIFDPAESKVPQSSVEFLFAEGVCVHAFEKG